MFVNIQQRLLGHGYVPDLIIDIGACVGNWTRTMLQIYPSSTYILFEAIDYRQLDDLRAVPNIIVHNALLNNENKIVDWYEQQNTGDSMFKELTHHFENVQPQKKESKTLNSFFSDGCNFNNVLIKIDCQGAEIPILEGATLLYDKIDFIILEIPFFGQYNENVPTFLEHIQFMDKIGFIVYDFLESHIANNFNIQVDIMFIRKNHPLQEKMQQSLLQKNK